jgi:hypothetical protein
MDLDAFEIRTDRELKQLRREVDELRDERTDTIERLCRLLEEVLVRQKALGRSSL